MDSPTSPITLLDELLNTQGETRELIALLRKRLSPVSNTTPQDITEKSTSVREGHISTAVGAQYEINRSIRNMIDELAV